jgi:Na+/H+ antiporter NhaD/arsenite permease-like protein
MHVDISALSQQIPLFTILPFAVLLLAIALLPLFTPHWWDKHVNKAVVAAALSLPIAIYLTTEWGAAGRFVLMEKVLEYTSFIILLAALYVITGGIYLEHSLSGTPLVNTGQMAVGAILANAIGTTGASVLLIRPLLRANRARHRKAHIVVFFIFVVSNCGGLLTPLGDPPLFLGFLKGVPFEWTLRLWPEWLGVNLLLLLVFNAVDQWMLAREERERPGSQLEEVMRHAPFKIHGIWNLAFLGGILLTILAAGNGVGFGGEPWPFGIKEAMMALLAITAYATTPKFYHKRNDFTFRPIAEVAILFAGIFVTMAPALAILNAWGDGARQVLGMEFGLSRPWQFFWATGTLSSFLDNAPTYLTFAATAAGLEGVPAEGLFLRELLAVGGSAPALLAAISCGAVMMGANTYIGNGPNFMVKAIAEEQGVKMPSFFGYMAYSVAILIPIFVVVTLVFFRG